MKISKLNKKGKEREIILYEAEEKDKRNVLKEKLYKEVQVPESVYSYVKGRGIKAAIAYAKDMREHYKYFIKCDISNFFPSIDITKLVDILYTLVEDIDLVKEIESILKQEKEIGISGLSVGSPISPMLSNIYLYYFDLHFINKQNMGYARFSDDMIFFCDELIKNEIIEKLSELGLTLSYDKLFIGDNGDIISFLGTDIKGNEVTKLIPNVEYKVIDQKRTTMLCNLIGTISTIEEFINALINNKTTLYKEFKANEAKEAIINTMIETKGYLFYSMFRYIVLEESKEVILSELVDKNQYSEAYDLEKYIESMNRLDEEEIYFLKVFGSNKHYYWSSITGRKDYEPYYGDINAGLRAHLKGEISLAYRVNNTEDTSSLMVFDIDAEGFSQDMDLALKVSKRIKSELQKYGYVSYIEFSGKKGYHVWCFFNKEILIKNLHNLGKTIENICSVEGVTIEIVPRYNSITQEENIIKLPLGLNPENSVKSYFENFYSLKEITYNEFKSSTSISKLSIDNLKEDYEEIFKVVTNCKVLRYIIEEGYYTGKMKHVNRLLILYSLMHVDKGSEFIHYLMEKLDNYSYAITEKYISKAPERPISCRKIRSYFEDSSELSTCNCNFTVQEGSYASPVLFASNNSMEKVNKELQIKEIFGEISELKKEKKSIERKINSLEKRLGHIFDMLNCDSIEVDIGILKRSEVQGKSTWIIELIM